LERINTSFTILKISDSDGFCGFLKDAEKLGLFILSRSSDITQGCKGERGARVFPQTREGYRYRPQKRQNQES
jgi:hypothetical protein